MRLALRRGAAAVGAASFRGGIGQAGAVSIEVRRPAAGALCGALGRPSAVAEAAGLGFRGFRAAPGALFADLTVPSMGDSISEGSIAGVLKEAGEAVEADEVVYQIETDKVTIDVRVPEAGVIDALDAKMGETVVVGQKLGSYTPGAGGGAKKAAPAKEAAAPTAPAATKAAPPPPPPPPSAPAAAAPAGEGAAVPGERRVPMTRLRKRIADRLKDSQATYALLTTFNEVDMTELMKMRTDVGEMFLKKHGCKLGFMSTFVKAVQVALLEEPAVNAVIDGDDIVYRDYVDVSIAVGTPKGLVVPVIRNVESLSFAGVEKTISALGERARAGSLAVEDMQGGTFTISNGGVYGSLMSTPIVNPPQSAIMGMHSITKRPMVMPNGEIQVRQMMYLALTYDHRLIDGREAVLFLKRVKDLVEDPRRMLLDC